MNRDELFEILKQAGRPEMLPRPVPNYEHDSSDYPDSIRVSFKNGKTIIYDRRAEMPGPDVGKLLPKASETARILYRIYLALNLLEIVLLVLGGSPLFDSVVHAMGTAGTGGFGIRSDSIGGYSSYIQWVITIFMLLFGINFNLYFFLLYRKFRAVVKSEELRAYLGIVIAAVLLILWNIRPLYSSASHALRDSAFLPVITTSAPASTSRRAIS